MGLMELWDLCYIVSICLKRPHGPMESTMFPWDSYSTAPIGVRRAWASAVRVGRCTWESIMHTPLEYYELRYKWGLYTITWWGFYT